MTFKNENPRDDLFKDLEAFGETLETSSGAQIRSKVVHVKKKQDDPITKGRVRKSRTLLVGSALAMFAVVIAGLTLVKNDEAPSDDIAHESVELIGEASTVYAIDGSVIEGYVVDDSEDEETRVRSENAEPFVRLVEQKIVDDGLLNLKGSSLAEVLQSGGLKIYTGYNPDFQAAALTSIKNSSVPPGDNSVDLVTVDTETGAINALVSRQIPATQDASVTENSVMEHKRKAGDAFGPVIYASALESGVTSQDSIAAGGPCAFKTASGDVNKLVGSSYGPPERAGSIGEELFSNKCFAARLGLFVGKDTVSKTAELLGLDVETVDTVLPIGEELIAPVDLTGAYASFANGGKKVTPWMIDRIEDPYGEVLYEREKEMMQILNSQTAYEVTKKLYDNVAQTNGMGTGRRAGMENHQVAGQTATDAQPTSVSFAGYTKQKATTVIVSNDEGVRIEIEGVNPFGGTIAAPLWADYMEKIHKNIDPIDFIEPKPVEDEGKLLEIPNGVEVEYPSTSE